MNKKISNTLTYIVFLLLGVLLLWLCFRKINFSDVLDYIKTAKYSWMLLSLACLGISLFFRALRWNILIESLGYKTRVSTTYESVLIAYFANTVFPRLGEVTRCGTLTKKENIPFDKSFGTVISERVLDLAILFAMALLVILFQWNLLGSLITSWLNPLIESLRNNVLLGGIAITAFIAFCATIVFFFRKKKSILAKNKLYQKLASLWNGFLDGIKTIFTMEKKGLFIFYTLLIWGFYVVMTWLPFYMLPETSHLGLTEAVKRYHPWIFSGAIETAAPDLQAGDIVTVVDSKNNILGTGFAEAGNIAVKVLAFENVKIDKFFWKERLNKAFELRKLMELTDNEHTNCYRLVHSEGDNLPGLIIDIYGKTAVVQAQTEGMALNVKAIADALMTVEGLNINAVYNKSSEAMQRMGKDAVEDGYLIGEKSDEFVLENDSKFLIDWEEGQKTGFFLDQRYNRDLVRQLAKGKNVLNTFCYTGGFSVTALKGGANKVVSVDCSKKAITACEKNIALNGFDIKENPSVAEDAKLFLQNMKKGEFDLIILDPPAFAKNHKSLHRGLQGYKFINYEAMTKIKEGGLLFTFSCSQAVDKAQFQSIVMAAAIEAGRKAQIIFQLDQPDDHPVNIYHPEGAYLKGLVLKID